MSYNFYPTDVTHLKCMTWWLLTGTYNCVTTTIIKIWNICINPNSSFLLLFCQFPPPSTAPGNHGLAVVVAFRTAHMWGYPAYGHSDYSFIYSPWCLWDLSTLLHLSFLCLLLLISISSHECTSVSLFTTWWTFELFPAFSYFE